MRSGPFWIVIALVVVIAAALLWGIGGMTTNVTNRNDSPGVTSGEAPSKAPPRSDANSPASQSSSR